MLLSCYMLYVIIMLCFNRSLLKFHGMAEAQKELPANLKYLGDSPVVPAVMKAAQKFDLPLYITAFKLNLLKYGVCYQIQI